MSTLKSWKFMALDVDFHPGHAIGEIIGELIDGAGVHNLHSSAREFTDRLALGLRRGLAITRVAINPACGKFANEAEGNATHHGDCGFM